MPAAGPRRTPAAWPSPPCALPETPPVAPPPAGAGARLVRRMDEVTLDRGDAVFQAGERIRHVYFPRTGILSMVVDMQDGGTVEAATMGAEGLAGLPLVFGTDRSPKRVYCQVPPCVCRRLPAAVF